MLHKIIFRLNIKQLPAYCRRAGKREMKLLERATLFWKLVEHEPIVTDISDRFGELFKIVWFNNIAVHPQALTFDNVFSSRDVVSITTGRSFVRASARISCRT